MIETIPEISVSELMERVRAKVEESQRIQRHSKLPPAGPAKEIATAIMPKPVTPKTEQILQAAQIAREATTTSRWIPKPLRGLFRRQDKYNREVLRTIGWLSSNNAQLADRLRHLTACIEIQDQQLTELRQGDRDWMSELARIRDTNLAWMEGAGKRLSAIVRDRGRLQLTTNALARRIGTIEQKILSTDASMAAVSRTAHEMQETFATLVQESADLRSRIGSVEQWRFDTDGRTESVEQRLDSVAQHNDQLTVQTNALQAEHTALAEAVRGLRAEFNNAAEHLRQIQIQADQLIGIPTDFQRDLGHRVKSDQPLGEQLEVESAQRAAIRHELQALEQRQTSDAAFIKAELSLQSEVVHKLIGQASAGAGAKTKRNSNSELTEAAKHRLDAFYFSFENRFRGPREEIKRRVRFYLPIVKKCRAGTRGRPIVDLGCGRGEWLELLREQKLTASGVDLNKTMIDQCKQRGLKVVQADALEFLRGLPDDSHGAITGFHIIEHLPLDTLVSLIAETFRVLHPGGVAIFESPNCKNLMVGACSFYIDPTHRHPIFPETAQFMLENKGFERVTLEYLCPMESAEIGDINRESAHLRELLYGPRDFGVIGYKPVGAIKRVIRSQ